MNRRRTLVCSTSIHSKVFSSILPIHHVAVYFLSHVHINGNDPIGGLRIIPIRIKFLSVCTKFIPIGENLSNFECDWSFFFVRNFF